MFVFCFQELLVILFLIIVVPPLPPKIRIMTAAAAVTVLSCSKEPGGTRAVITPTWTVCIITDNTRQGQMVSTGSDGKVITTPPRELRLKSDHYSFKNFLYLIYLLINAYGYQVTEWLKYLKMSFIIICYYFFSFL